MTIGLVAAGVMILYVFVCVALIIRESWQGGCAGRSWALAAVVFGLALILAFAYLGTMAEH